MRILVTGSAGFIGFHVCRRLLADGHTVFGLDGMTPYYDPGLKALRHRELGEHLRFEATIARLEDREAVLDLVARVRPEAVIHLAAQAGVRYSLENPEAYVASNLIGTFHVLEAAREVGVGHLMLASTSSVYGGNSDLPFTEQDPIPAPLTLYAATKTAAESMSHAYSHLWSIPTTAFRFFTVYGAYGRPDMALFKFVEAIEDGQPIEVYAGGAMARDFTFVGDLAEAIVRLLATPPRAGQPIGSKDSLSPVAPWRVVNIGRGSPLPVGALIEAIETALGKTAIRHNLPMQPGDMTETYADVGLLQALTGYTPSTDLQEAVNAFVEWWRPWREARSG